MDPAATGLFEGTNHVCVAVHRALEDLPLVGGALSSNMLRFCWLSPPLRSCDMWTLLLVKRLAECRHRASLAKLQYCRPDMTHIWDMFCRKVSRFYPERLQLLNMSLPQDKEAFFLRYDYLLSSVDLWLCSYGLLWEQLWCRMLLPQFNGQWKYTRPLRI